MDRGVRQGLELQPPLTFTNLWVIRLDRDARCTEFTEWWMDQRSG